MKKSTRKTTRKTTRRNVRRMYKGCVLSKASLKLLAQFFA